MPPQNNRLQKALSAFLRDYWDQYAAVPGAGDILDFLRNEIRRDKCLVADLFPGKCLAPARLTRAEQNRIALPAANRARAEKRKRHIECVLAEIQRARTEYPAISLDGIAQWLDVNEIPPLRTGCRWSKRAVRRVIKEGRLGSD